MHYYYKFCLFALLTLLPFLLFSQSCKDKLDVAENYLISYQNPSDSLVAQISKSVDSCLTSSPSSNYIKGMLNLYRANPSIERAIDYFLVAAHEGHAESSFMIGMLYKEGKGCVQDFEKAVFWFGKAAKLGSSRAIYSLGYMYLKGLGVTEPDYVQAVSFFEESHHPMAKHWLAVCNRYGLGINKDESTGFSLLRNNEISNSKYLIHKWNDSVQNVSKGEEKLSIRQKEVLDKQITFDNSKENYKSLDEETTSIDIREITSSYTGNLVEMDWFKNSIIAKSNVRVTIEYKPNQNNFNFVLEKDGVMIANSKAEFDNENIYPLDLEFSLPYLYGDSKSLDSLNFSVKSLHLSQIKLKNQEYLTMKVDAWVDKINEPAHPLYFILTKDLNAPLSREVSELNLQTENFIRLYPNPFEKELLIQYDLVKDSKISLMLYDFRGMPTKYIFQNTYQRKGEQTFRIQTDDIPSGQYILKITTAEGTYSKIALKK